MNQGAAGIFILLDFFLRFHLCWGFVLNRNSASESIKQKLVFVGSEEGKLLALRQTFAEASFSYSLKTLKFFLVSP